MYIVKMYTLLSFVLPLGSYESIPAGYHHMYFNVTWNTLCIWAITVVAVIGCYEATKHLVLLGQRRQLRLPMLVLFLASVYPHYYTWWSFVNMWNDDFYKQWPHQSYFSLTEAVSTFAILRLCDLQRPLNINALLAIVTVGAFHILAGSWDQFVSNVLLGKGHWYQQSRDLAFVGFDFLNVIVCSLYLWQLYRQSSLSRPGPTRKQLAISAGLVLLLTFITTLL